MHEFLHERIINIIIINIIIIIMTIMIIIIIMIVATCGNLPAALAGISAAKPKSPTIAVNFVGLLISKMIMVFMMIIMAMIVMVIMMVSRQLLPLTLLDS